ncbi:lysophospholipid acyltransferase family protein [Eubacterium sp. 1001713B170207_170306_E7]|uniref:lysophospholipid acyltransferase family protein n=1 Tax=Eubacterium sp. 1001713B170207_170306_E7 TaxID=2787097 RepID=UPI001898CC81|nr:lysophospholipid acyltransferase family protein [Eubacterium sp. 1001713B170207_170306_E7]
MSITQYQAENMNGGTVFGREEENCYFKNRFILRKVALILLPIYNRLMFGLEVSGKNNLENINSGMVTICNHVHTLDCTMIAGVCKQHRLYFPTLNENLKLPFVGHLVDDLGGIPIPEQLSEFRAFMEGLEATLRQGDAVHLFPEGSLVPYCPSIRSFQKGAFTFAYDAAVPLVPMVLTYRETKGVRSLFRKKPLLHLQILKPVYPNINNKRSYEIERLLKKCHSEMQIVLQKK